MKKLILSVLAALGFAAANAGDVPSIRKGHFLEDISAFAAEHPATSQGASGGDIVYATDDYEYHIFTKAGTLTFGAAVEDAQILLVGGGGGAGWNGGGGGGGGAFVELSNQSIAAGSYAVTVGAGGAAAYADSKAWGQTGGTSSIAGITGASAPGGTGGIGWNGKNGVPAATVGGQAGKAGNSAGGDGGNSGNSGDNSGANGSAGSKSMILGVEQGFAGGGGGGGHVESTKAHAPSYGQDGGGNGAGSEETITTKYLATAGEDGLGGGGGGGASGTWAGKWPLDGTTQNKSILQNAGDGGDGIVIVRLVVIHDDRIVPPEGKQLTYTGTLQRGVEEGEGYTLMGMVEATDVGFYTATATLDEGETWNDDTTDPKTIEWSITKAENSWLVEPALSKTSWPENKAPATLTKGAAKFGTMTATLNGEAFDLDNPEFPTVRGEYALVISVVGSDNWNGLEKQLAFTITEAIESVKHYMVGQDADKSSSFVKSSTSTIGWATLQGGPVDANHEVKEDDTYVVPNGMTLRTVYETENDDLKNVFKGDSLTIAGELNLRAATGTGRRKIMVNNLIADGGTINAASTQNHPLELAGSISIPADKKLKINLKSNEDNATHFNDLKISATVTGSGAIDPLLYATANKSTRAKLDLSGDWSGFTGDIESTQTASGGSKGFTLMISGSFGGRFSVMPQTDQDPNYVVNYGGLVDGKKFGLRFKDGFPNRTRYRTVFYNVDPEKKNLALVTCGMSVDPTSDKGLTGLYYEKTDSADTALSALLGDTATKFDRSKMTAVDNGNGTQTVFYNYVGFVTPTISGTIMMDDWTEGETPNVPSGLTVTPEAAQSSFSYKYYRDSECTQPISEKPTLAGTYYVRGEVAEGDNGEVFWTAAVSEPPKAFTIKQQAGGKTRVEIPVGKKLSYTGNEQVGVDAGEHYTLSNTFKATAVGNYEAVATLENTDDYEWTDLTTAPKTIAWSIKKAENTWTRRASITKKFWKSTEDPGDITTPTAAFGEPKAQIATNGGAFTDWDGTMPAGKGKYEVRWTVAETESYSALEDSVKFLIDYRYEPTAPFMVSTDNGETWTGKATLVDACQNSGIVEVCENVDVSELPVLTVNVTLRSNTDDGGARYTITVTADSSFGIYNNGKLTLSNIAFNLLPSANISKFASLGVSANNMDGSIEIKENVEFSGKVTGGFIQNENGHDGTLHTHITISGGTIKDLTAGKSLISAPGDASFSVKNLTIENCTVSNGALIAAGNKTLNLSDVTITNNVTTAGAITVSYVNELTNGVIKVSGDVIVRDNTANGVEKNIVLQNAENLQMVGDLDAGAAVGVSYGLAGDQFGVYDETCDAKTAAKFFNDAKPALMGKARNGILSWTGAGLMLLIK